MIFARGLICSICFGITLIIFLKLDVVFGVFQITPTDNRRQLRQIAFGS